MCGRYALFCSKDDLTGLSGLRHDFVMKEKFNIAPTQMCPIITAKGVEFARWGLVPHWYSAQNDIPQGYINARIEGINSKPSFKDAFKRTRCLVPASGYYEWKLVKGVKQPFYVFNPNQLILFAGLFSQWKKSSGQIVDTFTILTMPANNTLKELHERQPVMLEYSKAQQYIAMKAKTLDENSISALQLQEGLHYYPVSKKVNHPKFDDKMCVAHL